MVMIAELSWILITLSVAITSLYHIVILILASLRHCAISVNSFDGEAHSLSIVIPSKNEPRDIVLSNIGNFNNMKNILDSSIHILYIFDDSPDYVKSIVENIETENIMVILRINGRGRRNGAINDGFRFSYEDNVMVLDVDAKVGIDVIETAKKCKDVCVFLWRSYLRYRNFLEEAAGFITDYGSWILYKIRSKAGLFVYPLGCGTVFSNRVFRDIGMLREDVIQDDMYLGTKLLGINIVPKIVNGFVSVSVPQDLYSMRIQQCRWSYGTVYVLTRYGFREMLRSRLRLMIRVDALFYLMQPLLTSLYFLGIVLAFVSSILEHNIPIARTTLYIALFTIFTALESISVGMFLKSEKLYSPRKSLFLTGRASALMTLLSIPISIYAFFGIVGRRYEYRITPKIRVAKGVDISLYIVLLLGSAITLFSFYNYNTLALFTGLQLLAAGIYGAIRFR